ncbi:hypothetical protein EDD18DRAFT_1114086 [Armillaria luteobubalina]|uniref:Uncharacterized protein n=1 Tax=Armillaria luteobubalina TaxID=153913 RepID=A0AA39P7C7_9AGAR|nr:hypothetical protein EDD18DRAFT_1114086 [Armillaria luteobubalina]
MQEGLQMLNISLQKDNNDFIWQLVKKIDQETEELVFACTGVICEVDLPPVIRTPRSFDETIATLQEIRLMGEREFKNGMLDKWTPSTKDINPLGILQRSGKMDITHTEDNKVQYFKANIDSKGRRRFQRARPQMFRIGDIIEVQWSVIMFKVKGARHRMKLVLQAIAMLDCNIMLDAKRMASKLSVPEDTGPKHLKRKIRFMEEETVKGIVTKRAKEGPSMDKST